MFKVPLAREKGHKHSNFYCLSLYCGSSTVSLAGVEMVPLLTLAPCEPVVFKHCSPEFLRGHSRTYTTVSQGCILYGILQNLTILDLIPIAVLQIPYTVLYTVHQFQSSSRLVVTDQHVG